MYVVSKAPNVSAGVILQLCVNKFQDVLAKLHGAVKTPVFLMSIWTFDNQDAADVSCNKNS